MFDRMRLLTLASMSIITLIMLQGCSTSFPDYPVVAVRDGLYAQEEDSIATAVSPVTQRDESVKYFGVNMLARNILPVHVLVENKGQEASLILDRQKIFLEGVESYDHNKKVKESGTGEVLATAGSAALIAGPLVAAPVGMLIGGKMASDAQMIQQNMMAKRLDRHTLSPGTAEHGFVYFDVTRYKNRYPANATISIELIELGTNKKHVIDLSFQWKD